VVQGERVLLTLLPTSAGFRWPAPRALPERLTLSRFAYLRRDGSELILESPKCHCRVSIRGGRVLRSILALVEAGTAERALRSFRSSHRDGELALSVLLDAGFLVADTADGGSVDDRLPLAVWEFHDLLFHARSRRGRHAHPMGGTFRFEGRFEEPTLQRRFAGEPIPLPRPGSRVMDDFSLRRALESRQSTRAQGREPLRSDQLSELLFHSAGARPLDDGPGPRWRRAYPSGGARYPLEVYAAIRTCNGLEPGLYHYDPIEHCLRFVRGAGADLQRLLDETQVGPEAPQVALVLAARFQRVSHKYESIAYALILKEAGALLQTLYLVGAALGIGVCAVGNGDSELFARLSGMDPHVEAPVSEIVVGSSS